MIPGLLGLRKCPNHENQGEEQDNNPECQGRFQQHRPPLTAEIANGHTVHRSENTFGLHAKVELTGGVVVGWSPLDLLSDRMCVSEAMLDLVRFENRA